MRSRKVVSVDDPKRTSTRALELNVGSILRCRKDMTSKVGKVNFVFKRGIFGGAFAAGAVKGTDHDFFKK